MNILRQQTVEWKTETWMQQILFEMSDLDEASTEGTEDIRPRHKVQCCRWRDPNCSIKYDGTKISRWDSVPWMGNLTILQAMMSLTCLRFSRKETTYLMYRRKLFGHFFINNQGMIGATAPTRKKYKSATEWRLASIQIGGWERCFTASLDDQRSTEVEFIAIHTGIVDQGRTGALVQLRLNAII